MKKKTIKIKIVKDEDPINEYSTDDDKEGIFAGYKSLKQLSKGIMEEEYTGESVVNLYVSEIMRLSKHLHSLKKQIKQAELELKNKTAQTTDKKCPDTTRVLNTISQVVAASKGKFGDKK